jgi:uncharacterized phage protein (TIGR01671 family)
MREILFRGKRLQGDHWVEGYFFKSDINYRERTSGKASLIFTPDCDTFIMIPESHNSVMVQGDTVGQFTGLTDKNGKRIFEGDILQIAKKSDTLGTYFFPPVQYPINVVVKWDLCAWMWEVQGKEGPYYIHFPDAWCHYECKVIGNIHDNHELLEGE